jgi:hypothetical protein
MGVYSVLEIMLLFSYEYESADSSQQFLRYVARATFLHTIIKLRMIVPLKIHDRNAIITRHHVTITMSRYHDAFET